MILDREKPLWQLTTGEFLDLIKENVPHKEEKVETSAKYVYGIVGIAELFNVSKTTANRIKQSGVINKAIKQHGRTIIIDAELALSLFGSKKTILK